MQRLAVAVILVALAAVVVTTVTGRLSRRFRDADAGAVVSKGDGMPKIAFFLLLCLMAYAISTGAG